MSDENKTLVDTNQDTTFITSAADLSDADIRRMVAAYSPDNRNYSQILSVDSSTSDITFTWVSENGANAQNDHDKIETINAAVMKYVNIDDILGMVVQSIQNNINTEIRHSYKNFGEQRNKAKTLAKARQIIEDFDEQIDIKRFIRESVITAYLEGNYYACLRGQPGDYHVDQLPFSIIENSGFEIDGNAILLVNMQSLKEKVSGTTYKKRNGDNLFFKDVEETIQRNYRPEVLAAYQDGDSYARLDPDHSGAVRVNNYGRKYGLTPLFRALAPMLMLIQYQNADSVTAKSRAKKIIHQKMREKCLGTDGNKKAYTELKFAHEQLMKAWKQNTVVITTPPTVESITYVEPQAEDIAVDKVMMYRNKVLSSLGVSFLANDNSQAASTSSLNLKQLMRCINRITEQVEEILQRFYKMVLTDNHIDVAYCPTVDIIDAEMMETSMKMELAKMLYCTFGASRSTTMQMLGISAEDEMAKRKAENEDEYDEVFTPHITSYTATGTNSGGSNGGTGDTVGNGRKANTTDTVTEETDLDKQAKKEYDQQYNENKRALE